MELTDLHFGLLSLIRLGIRHPSNSFPCNVEWPAIQSLAEKQGLYAIVLDGIERLPQSSRPNQELLLEWIGEVLQGYEYRYEQYCKTIWELAGFYNYHGFKMMVLKGYACSLDWPKPSHRPCGDIDIWLFGKQKEADEALGEWFKGHGSRLEIDEGHHHHTVFNWGEFTVENHYDFVNVHHRKSNSKLESIFKELGQDDSFFVGMKDISTGSATKVYLPSPNLHALFLIKHMVSHFAAAEITLRQVIDWAFFVEKHTNEIDWEWLNRVVEEFHMKDFISSINAICVEDLGFEDSIFLGVQFNHALKDRILMDILNPEFEVSEPKLLLPRMLYKYRRWRGNAWKHELCYNESLQSAFWSGIKNHLLKPRSI